MKHIWSPWRMKYIQDLNKDDKCVFCLEKVSPDSEENLVVFRGEHVFVILNRYPYTSGHLMVVPYDHKPSVDSFSADTLTEMMEMVSRCIQILRLEYYAQGFNIGANIGSAAGAGIPKHFHFHIVPRWGGDTNFISAIGETRVVPEAIEDSYMRLKAAWNNYLKKG